LFKRKRFLDLPPIDPSDPAITILARDLQLQGKVHTPGDAVVAGAVEGDVQVGGRLHVLEGSRIRGTVIAGDAKIEGTVEGPLVVGGRLEVGRNARIEGDLSAGKVAIAEGAMILGALKVASEPQRFVEQRDGAAPELTASHDSAGSRIP
jgi:cytoskeletal protein CcmA (bactofilin family)